MSTDPISLHDPGAAGSTASAALARMSALEMPVCQVLNRSSRRAPVRVVFGAVSRLGNGVFWVAAAVAAILLRPTQAPQIVLQGGLAAVGCLAAYRALKRRTARPRPYALGADIVLTTAPLDRYSFPSGHTMHAVAVSMVLVHHCPGLAWLVLPFAGLVAASGLVLGLHYPSDVMVGGVIGAAGALLALWL